MSWESGIMKIVVGMCIKCNPRNAPNRAAKDGGIEGEGCNSISVYRALCGS